MTVLYPTQDGGWACQAGAYEVARPLCLMSNPRYVPMSSSQEVAETSMTNAHIPPFSSTSDEQREWAVGEDQTVARVPMPGAAWDARHGAQTTPRPQAWLAQDWT